MLGHGRFATGFRRGVAPAYAGCQCPHGKRRRLMARQAPAGERAMITVGSALCADHTCPALGEDRRGPGRRGPVPGVHGRPALPDRAGRAVRWKRPHRCAMQAWFGRTVRARTDMIGGAATTDQQGLNFRLIAPVSASSAASAWMRGAPAQRSKAWTAASGARNFGVPASSRRRKNQANQATQHERADKAITHGNTEAWAAASGSEQDAAAQQPVRCPSSRSAAVVAAAAFPVRRRGS